MLKMPTRAPLYAFLLCMLSTAFFVTNVDIVKHIEVDTTLEAAGSIQMRKHKRRKGASHVDVKTVRRKEAASERKRKDAISQHALEEKLSTDVKRKSKRKPKDATKPAQPGNHYHNNAVLITHYHKTGYVLSRELMFLLHQIEHEVNSPDLKADQRGAKFEVSGVDENGERYAFDGIGNWQRSAFTTRKHNERQCPYPVGRQKSQVVLPETKGFTLREGTIYVQESPDLYCTDEEILEGLSLSHAGGTKIIHFVRNPYEMVLSNYFYHSQDPTPGESNVALT
jgi:DNA-binding protein H-NS